MAAYKFSKAQTLYNPMNAGAFWNGSQLGSLAGCGSGMEWELFEQQLWFWFNPIFTNTNYLNKYVEHLGVFFDL